MTDDPLAEHPMDFHPMDWHIVVEALLFYINDFEPAEPARRERAWELIAAIANEQGLSPEEFLREGWDVRGSDDSLEWDE